MKKPSPIAALGLCCASCGGLIETLNDGWVEWLVLPDGKLSGFRLVHNSRHGRCMYREERQSSIDVEDHHLSHFVGVLGMMRLAARIADSKGTDASEGELLLSLGQTALAGWEAEPSLFELDHDDYRRAYDAWKAAQP